MNRGEHWMYRRGRKDVPTEVEILAVGIERPLRVKVAFLENEYGGRVRWVPPSQIKAPWGERLYFLRREKEWDALGDLADDDVGLADAVGAVFRLLVPRAVADIDGRRMRKGVLTIFDVDQFESLCGAKVGLPLREIRPQVVEEGVLNLAWPIAVRAAKVLAARNPDRVMTMVQREEASRSFGGKFAALGRSFGEGSAESDAEDADDLHKHCALLRAWCGAPARERDLQSELRAEIDWLRAVSDILVGEIHELGAVTDAWRFHKLLYPHTNRADWRSDLESTRGARALQVNRIRSATWRKLSPGSELAAPYFQANTDAEW